MTIISIQLAHEGKPTLTQFESGTSNLSTYCAQYTFFLTTAALLIETLGAWARFVLQMRLIGPVNFSLTRIRKPSKNSTVGNVTPENLANMENLCICASLSGNQTRLIDFPVPKDRCTPCAET